MIEKLTSAVLRRRKRGRDLVEKLQRISNYLQDQHCGFIPDERARAAGFLGLPAWDHPSELLAARIVSEMRTVVNINEAFARTEDQKRFDIIIGQDWCGAPMPKAVPR